LEAKEKQNDPLVLEESCEQLNRLSECIGPSENQETIEDWMCEQ
jgi:hypothetical protein